MGLSCPACPVCGSEVTEALQQLESQEAERLELRRHTVRVGDETPALKDRLRPPLQPPKEPLALGIGLGIFLAILVIMGALGYPEKWFNFVLAFLGAAGLFSVWKDRYKQNYIAWRENANGASVCLKCWACFHPKT